MNDSVKKWGKWAVNAKSFNKCSVSEENNYLSCCITVGVNYVVHVKYPEWCLAVVLSKDSSQHYFVSLPWLFPIDVLAASWWDQALLVLLWLDASLGTLQSSTPTTGSTHPSEHFHPFPRGKDWFCLEWTHSWCPALLGLGFRVPHLDTECHEDIKWHLTVHGDFSLWNRGGHPRKPRFSSVQFSRSVVSDSLQPHESQHTRPPCPSSAPGVYSNSCPWSRWQVHNPVFKPELIG